MFFPIEDYYDIVVDKKIQAVVDELKKLPHDVLIRNMTYWMDYLDEGKYVVESDFPHEEWFVDCEHYAAATTDEERYKQWLCSRSAKLGLLDSDEMAGSPYYIYIKD